MSKFAKGDRVRITGNTSGSLNRIGELGTVISDANFRGERRVLGDDTRSEERVWTYPDEMEHVNVTDKVFDKIDKFNEGICMSLVDKVKQLSKNKDTRLLEEYGVVDSTGSPTGEGQDLLIQHLFELHKPELIEKIKLLDAENKKKKK